MAHHPVTLWPVFQFSCIFYFVVIFIWQYPSKCKYPFVLCLWLRDVGDYHSVGLPTRLRVSCHSAVPLFSGTSELIHSFQASSFMCPNPALSCWPHSLFHRKVEAFSGNSFIFLQPHQHGTCMCSVCVLCVLLILFLYNQIYQTDVCMCSPHSLNCYFVPDSLQSSFDPHCDTRTAFVEGRKDHLVGILWSSSYSCG